MPVELEVVGIRIELPANQPIVLLKAVYQPRFLPIWIGSGEANAIGIAQRGLEPPRPLSHNLMADIIAAYDDELKEVVITGREQHIYYAELRTEKGKAISARPSDALALALIADCPVYTTEELIEEAGIEAPEADEEEVAQFREFLDHVSPEDFEGEAGQS
ncbi:bifunctional nuclease family protein [Brevibacterium sp. BRM-1]|uniref:bifunctional nuclease family protein n=1 Tax=Brevibacterium sp. BRM-1 TaxID=2999062 RepID=UPI0022800BAE|nr:bifunctional nuclease family protein [Brevibacterium sp. BRM-1]WAL41104.1 bifunctional nuclease family protein [Brevibacterium sp. BRM-1]